MARSSRHTATRPTRMRKVWVPFEQTSIIVSNRQGGTNEPIEINNVVAASTDIQVPFNFLTAGNTVGDQTTQIASPCTLLAVSLSAVMSETFGVTGFVGVGCAQTNGANPVDAPVVLASQVPGAFPYTSPIRPVGGESGSNLYTVDTLQRGKRKLTPGMIVYLSMWLSQNGTSAENCTMHVTPRILFGVHD